MTTQTVEGYTPSSLYEFATRCGIHAGSLDKLVHFAISLQEAQRRAVADAEETGLYEPEAAK